VDLIDDFAPEEDDAWTWDEDLVDKTFEVYLNDDFAPEEWDDL